MGVPSGARKSFGEPAPNNFPGTRVRDLRTHGRVATMKGSVAPGEADEAAKEMSSLIFLLT